MITIFTPTYNRSDLLKRAYHSLLNQTNKKFEWVIVDDGSTDDTLEVVAQFVADQKIKIVIGSQSNGGKHIAVNHGLKLASGKLFLILDSDDQLTFDAIDQISLQWEKLKLSKEIDQFAGLVFNKGFLDGSLIGNSVSESIDATIIHYRYQLKIKGDKLEIFKTDVLKNFPFPHNGEKFCPEALIWNRIGSKYKFRFLNEVIYLAEYLPDGLTDKIVSVRKKSPMNTATYYAELTCYEIPVVEKLKAAVNFWRFSIYNKEKIKLQKTTKINLLLSLFALPIGVLLGFRERRK